MPEYFRTIRMLFYCGFADALSAGLETHVEPFHGMGKCTHRDEIDTALSIITKSIKGYSPRRFNLNIRAVVHMRICLKLCIGSFIRPDMLHGFHRAGRCEVIEHDAVYSGCQGLIDFFRVAHFQFNLKVLAVVGAPFLQLRQPEVCPRQSQRDYPL